MSKNTFTSEIKEGGGYFVRPAVVNDFDGIKKLADECYDGHDYICNRFYSWISEDKWFPFVCVFENIIVGLAVGGIVDEGRTLMLKALRVLKYARGNGITKKIHKAIIEYVRMNFPLVTRQRLTVKEGIETAKKISQKEAQIVMTTFSLASMIDQCLEISSVIDNDANNLISKCDKRYVIDEVFKRNKMFFPNDIYTFDDDPYDISVLHADVFFCKDDVFFVTEIRNVKSDDNPTGYECNHIAAFSQGRPTPYGSWVHWCIKIHAEDPSLFRIHILRQFQEAISVLSLNFILVVECTCEMYDHAKKVIRDELKLKPDESYENAFGKCYVVEAEVSNV